MIYYFRKFQLSIEFEMLFVNWICRKLPFFIKTIIFVLKSFFLDFDHFIKTISIYWVLLGGTFWAQAGSFLTHGCFFQNSVTSRRATRTVLHLLTLGWYFWSTTERHTITVPSCRILNSTIIKGSSIWFSHNLHFYWLASSNSIFL